MKSFKQFINEIYSTIPVVDIETTGTTDVSLPEIKNELNRNIDLILRQSFKTIEESLVKLSKLLAMYSLSIPQVESNDIKSGSVDLVVGHHNINWDEFDGEIQENPYILKFSFILIDGLYKCSAELK